MKKHQKVKVKIIGNGNLSKAEERVIWGKFFDKIFQKINYEKTKKSSENHKIGSVVSEDKDKLLEK